MGHTKTAVSLPDELFRRLEERAAEEGAPRSAIVALALEQYLRSSNSLTERINQVLDSLEPGEIEAEARRGDDSTARAVARWREDGERW